MTNKKFYCLAPAPLMLAVFWSIQDFIAPILAVILMFFVILGLIKWKKNNSSPPNYFWKLLLFLFALVFMMLGPSSGRYYLLNLAISFGILFFGFIFLKKISFDVRKITVIILGIFFVVFSLFFIVKYSIVAIPETTYSNSHRPDGITLTNLLGGCGDYIIF